MPCEDLMCYLTYKSKWLSLTLKVLMTALLSGSLSTLKELYAILASVEELNGIVSVRLGCSSLDSITIS